MVTGATCTGMTIFYVNDIIRQCTGTSKLEVLSVHVDLARSSGPERRYRHEYIKLFAAVFVAYIYYFTPPPYLTLLDYVDLITAMLKIVIISAKNAARSRS